MTIDIDDKRQAILDAQEHILVLGGPGSGKTTIALLKVKSIYPSLLPGQKLLFLSFSRAAVRQILTRCQTILTYEERKAIEVKTYHSFCLECLTSHGQLLAGKPVSVLYPTNERLEKSNFEGNWTVERERFAKENSCYCFDLFASGVAELLERSIALKRLLASCYPMIIVDEFQDTDDDQWRIIQALSSVTRIFCLADLDQRIFEYRDNVDPRRIQKLQEVVSPATFDLGSENHRSPNGKILAFADSVLKNKGPLPATEDVKYVNYWPKAFAATVHAAVVWTFSRLRRQGNENPCIAVLARSNPLVAQLSGFLYETNTYKGTPLSPVEHRVVWDAELASAAGTVVASIMEWSQPGSKRPIVSTLEAIAHFYDLKNATAPSKSAAEAGRKFRDVADNFGVSGPRIKAGKELIAAFERQIKFVGDPVADWRTARQILKDISQLNEIFREARMVRLFHATDALGSGLANRWLDQGHYGGAASFVAQTLERERLISADQDPRGCLLMTIHKSKGKEFDGVVLVEGPFIGPFLDTYREEPPFEKSRRLLRVGITRAKSCVTLIRPNKATPLVR